MCVEGVFWFIVGWGSSSWGRRLEEGVESERERDMVMDM